MADSQRLPVVETFHSLQGEGHHAGRSAFFIRLAGCSVGCPWCDTKHSWPAQGHPEQPVDALADAAQMAAEAGASFVVITGGEPLHHDLQPLTQSLDARCGLPLHPWHPSARTTQSGCCSRAGRAASEKPWLWSMCVNTPNGASACKATNGLESAEGGR